MPRRNASHTIDSIGGFVNAAIAIIGVTLISLGYVAAISQHGAIIV